MALSAFLALGLSGCIADLPFPSSDEPLLQPSVYDPLKPSPRKSPGDGPITTAAQKRAGGTFEPQVQFGSGEFVQEAQSAIGAT
jgi:hypothetical protein